MAQTAPRSPSDAPVCIVTGSSQGLGKAIALALAKEGAKLVLSDIAPAGSEEVAEQIKKTGGEAIVIKTDVSKPDDVKSLFEQVKAKWQTVDVLVNNAGIVDENLIKDLTHDQWRNLIDVNLSSAFYTTKAALEIMSEKGKGRIINMSSICALGFPMQANYAAAKAGLIGLTKTVAKEYASQKIVCNAVAPGFIETPMTIAIGQRHPEASEMVKAAVPLGYMGKPEYIADIVTYLGLHPSAEYITGQVLHVDGGANGPLYLEPVEPIFLDFESKNKMA